MINGFLFKKKKKKHLSDTQLSSVNIDKVAMETNHLQN